MRRKTIISYKDIINKTKHILDVTEFETAIYLENKQFKVFKLYSYGCDFYAKRGNRKILAESKKTFSLFSCTNAIIQLIYGKECLEKEKQIKIDELILFYKYDCNIKADELQAKKYLKHFNIKLIKLVEIEKRAIIPLNRLTSLKHSYFNKYEK